jgi:membrane-bound lytic murein transglycosylase D
VIIATLLFVVVALAGFTGWKVYEVRLAKRAIDARILEVEALLQKAGQSPDEADELLDRLNRYQGEAKTVTSSFLYRVSGGEKVDPVEDELKSLMAEFGAETYRFPPEFLEQVDRFVTQYQGPNRPHIVSALGSSRKDLETMRAIFKEHQLPPDLAYIAIVESAVTGVSNRTSGAAGPWQFMPPTARAFGLVVNDKVDERLDVRKSTLAACKLMRELILDFGAEGSVMLAVAAYNGGSGRV